MLRIVLLCVGLLSATAPAKAITLALSGQAGTVTASVEYYDIQTVSNPSPGQFIGFQSYPYLYVLFNGPPLMVPLISQYSIAPTASFSANTFIASDIIFSGTFNIPQGGTFLTGGIGTQDYGLLSFNTRFLFSFSDGVLADPSQIPIPATFPLFAAGITALGLLSRRSRKLKSAV
jgi:hypothetical protein